jgi:hypothetical protein
MATVFISYSREDNQPVTRLLKHLKPVFDKHGLEVWKDDLSLLAGDLWQEKLERELDKCTLMVALLSIDALSSTWCDREWTRARARGLRIIPVLVRSFNLPEEHPLRIPQLANMGRPLVVADAFHDDIAAHIAQRIDAALDEHRRALDEQQPATTGSPGPWTAPPLLPPDHSTPALHPPEQTRWLDLRPDAAGVFASWRDTPTALPLHEARLPAVPDAVQRLFEQLAAAPERVSEAQRLAVGGALWSWLLPDDEARQAAVRPWARDGQPLRLRVTSEAPELLQLPWRLLAEGRYGLIREGRWTVELGPPSPSLGTPRTASSSRLLVIAPFHDDREIHPERGAAWVIEQIRGWVKVHLGAYEPAERRDHGWIQVARTVHDVQRWAPRSLVVVLCEVEVGADRSLSLRMEGSDGGVESLPLRRLSELVGLDRQVLYLDALDSRRRQSGEPLPMPTDLARQWPCVLSRGVKASARDHADALLAWLHGMLACGRDPVTAAHQPPSLGATLTEGALTAFSMLRLHTTYATWQVETEVLGRHEEVVRVHIDRTDQRAAAWNQAQEITRTTRWRAQHALVLGSSSEERLELVGQQIVRHVKQRFNEDKAAAVKVESFALPGLPTDLDLEGALLERLHHPDLERSLHRLADTARLNQRVLLLVDWGVLGPEAPKDCLQRFESDTLREWLRLSHQRIAPLCDKLNDRLGVLHVLAARSAPEMRDRVERSLNELVPRGQRHASVTASLLPPLKPVSREDVRKWLGDHAALAPSPHDAIAASIIERTGGRFNDVVQVLKHGLRFGFDHDLRAGNEILDEETNKPDW